MASLYADIVNRISVRYQLRPLTKEQTHRYIDHQVVQHGGDSKIFDESVKDLIHDFTAGNPRSINNVAIARLLSATAARSLRIDDKAFHLAASEVYWNRRSYPCVIGNYELNQYGRVAENLLTGYSQGLSRFWN